MRRLSVEVTSKLRWYSKRSWGQREITGPIAFHIRSTFRYVITLRTVTQTGITALPGTRRV